MGIYSTLQNRVDLPSQRRSATHPSSMRATSNDDSYFQNCGNSSIDTPKFMFTRILGATHASANRPVTRAVGSCGDEGGIFGCKPCWARSKADYAVKMYGRHAVDVVAHDEDESLAIELSFSQPEEGQRQGERRISALSRPVSFGDARSSACHRALCCRK